MRFRNFTFNWFLLAFWCTCLIASNAYIISNKFNYCFEKDSFSLPKQINCSIKNKNIKNFFNISSNNTFFVQNTYYHNSSPVAEIENLISQIVLFDYESPFLFISSDQKNYDNNNSFKIDDRNLIISSNQEGSYETEGNSGSYYYYDEINNAKRIIDWNNVINNNVYLIVSTKNEYKYDSIPSDIWLDTKLIWKKGTYLDGLNSIKVFQKGDNPAYEYQPTEELNFLKGIDKNMYNGYTDIYAYPYIYVLESYYVYVVYNYGARYFYTISPKIMPIQNIDYNSLTYDLSDLIKISDVDHLNHNVIFTINEDFLNVIESNNKIYDEKYATAFYEKYDGTVQYDVLDSFFYPLIKLGYINIDNIDEILNCDLSIIELNKYLSNNHNDLYYQLDKYKINMLPYLYDGIQLLINNMKIKFDLTLFNKNNKQYENKTYSLNLKDLINGYKLNLAQDNNNEYKFKFNNIHIEPLNNDFKYAIVEADNDFSLKYSTTDIELEDSWLKINEPEVTNVVFYDLDNSFKNSYPSEINIKDLINNYIFFTDENNRFIYISDADLDKFSAIPNDLDGTLKLNVDIDGHDFSYVYKNLKSFDIGDYTLIDVTQKYSNYLASEINNNEIKQILLDNGFDPYLLDELNININNADDLLGSIDVELVNKQHSNYLMQEEINFYGFSKVDVNGIYDSSILNKMNIKDVTEQDVKNYLLDFSNGFKNKYGDNYNLNISKDKNQLIVSITTDDFYKSLTFSFSNTKNIINYIFLIILGVSLIGLISTIVYYSIKNKNIKQQHPPLEAI